MQPSSARTFSRFLAKAGPATAVLMLLAACSGSDAPPAPPPPEVGFITLKAESAPVGFELPGRTVPYMISDVRPQVNGIIQKRLFEEGADVKRGQFLYQIDPAPYEAAVAQAKANLAKAEANLVSITARADRYGQLVGIDAVSKQEADDAAAAKGQAQADVAAAKAAVRTATINLDYTRVVAPISGRIGRSGVTPGALVTAGQAAPLATIQSLDPIYVDVTQSSSQLLRIRRAISSGGLESTRAARVHLTLPDGSEYAQEGSLQFSEVSVDPSSGSVVIRAVFPNPDRLLLPGMYVKAQLVAGSDPNAILAPQRAITRDPKGQAVAMVIDAENKVEQRMVQTATTVGANWLISSGLQVGDRLIVDGFQRIQPGMTVTPVAADGTPGGTPPATSADTSGETPAAKG